MSQNGQRRVFVAQAEGKPLSEIDILKLLSAAEIDLGTVKFVETVEDVESLSSIDAVVMILRDDSGKARFLMPLHLRLPERVFATL